MIEQAIKDIGGIADTDIDNLDVEGCVLIRDMGVEHPSGFRAVLRIDVTGTFSMVASLESLPI